LPQFSNQRSAPKKSDILQFNNGKNPIHQIRLSTAKIRFHSLLRLLIRLSYAKKTQFYSEARRGYTHRQNTKLPYMSLDPLRIQDN